MTGSTTDRRAGAAGLVLRGLCSAEEVYGVDDPDLVRVRALRLG